MKDKSSQLEEKVEKKAKRRQKKRRPSMRVSGKSVFQLRKTIRKKSKK